VVRLKTAHDLRGIYASGQLAGRFLQEVRGSIRPGVSTADLDALARDFMAKNGARAAFLGYKGYPGSICVSVNEQVVHGIPGDRRLAAGDLVSVDVGVELDGYYADAAWSFLVDTQDGPPDTRRLMEGTRDSLYAGIGAVVRGETLRGVSRAIERELGRHSLGIVRELTGHGTGFELHEDPSVFNYDPMSSQGAIEDGLVVAIEPMAALGSGEVLQGKDNWLYFTADGSLAAHYEHTVACWEGRAWVLTDPTDEEARVAFGGLK